MGSLTMMAVIPRNTCEGVSAAGIGLASGILVGCLYHLAEWSVLWPSGEHLTDPLELAR
jgi:hypothetical protein